MKESKRQNAISLGVVLVVLGLIVTLLGYSRLHRIDQIRGEVPGARVEERVVLRVSTSQAGGRRSRDRSHSVQWQEPDGHHIGSAFVSRRVYDEFAARLAARKERLEHEPGPEVPAVTVRVAYLDDEAYMVRGSYAADGRRFIFQVVLALGVLALVAGAGMASWAQLKKAPRSSLR